MSDYIEKSPFHAKRYINAASILEDAVARLEEPFNEKLGVFIVKPGNKWLKEAKEKPVPKALYMCLWYEGELCILYAETNTGKSILAVLIAHLISASQPVIYFDFELSDKQFEARYSNNFTNHFVFHKIFYRAEINPDEADYKDAGFASLEEYINASIERAIIETGARVLVIDNLTYLRSEQEKAKEALPLMKHLKQLKSKYGLSILALAHTPKRSNTKPISRDDLAGSKMLINFCDSAFAIGESQKDKRIRYIKQIKARHCEVLFDTENVALFEITKPDNFLAFTPVHGTNNVHGVHTTSEHEHLRQLSKEDKDNIISQVIELSNNGYSQRNISKELGISLGLVNKHLKCSRS